jgi:putative ABC transport system permease protein
MSLLYFELSLTLRRLLRRPAQGALLFGTFSVSIGLALVSWAVFHTLYLKQPSFDPQGRLLALHQRPEVDDNARVRATHDEFGTWRDGQSHFELFAAAVLHRAVFVGTPEAGGVERVFGANLSSGLLRDFGVAPVLGRLFGPDEDVPGCAPAVLLSQAFWERRFHRDPAIIGQTLQVDGRPAVVVGVMPAGFSFPNQQDLWLALGFHPSFPSRSAPILDIVARLRPGVSMESARRELEMLSGRRTAEVRTAREGLAPILQPFRYVYLRPQLRLSALVLLVLSLVFVAISCVNSAHQVLIEYSSRASEVAAATALGLPRLAIARGVFLHLLVVTLAGALLGIVALLWLAPYVYSALRLWDAPYWLSFSLESHHVFLGLGVALLAALITSIGPVLHLAGTPVDTLIRSGANPARRRQQSAGRRVLLSVQVALLTVLTVFAALLLRSSFRLNLLSWGFDPERVYNLRTGMRPADFPSAAARSELRERLLAGLRSVPGVSAAALAHELPGYENRPDSFYARTAGGLEGGGADGRAIHLIVSDEFFAALKIPFVHGTTFARGDAGDGVDAAIVTRGLAKRLWPGENPVGKELYFRKGYNVRASVRPLVIHGVVEDIRSGGPMLREHDTVFTHMSRESQLFYFLLVRGDQALPEEAGLRAAAADVDSRLPLYFGAPFARQLAVGMQVVHLTTRLTLLFAFMAVLLCAVGVYSLTVSQLLERTREFGIRLAVGGDPWALWRPFLRGNLVAIGGGLGLGLGAAAVTSPFLATLLTDVTPWDLRAFAGATLVIVGASAAACVPSWRQLRRIDPAECLRTL